MRFCERCNQREGVFQTLLMLVCHQCVRCDDQFCEVCNGRFCMACVTRESHAMCVDDCPSCCWPNEEDEYPLREYTRQEVMDLIEAKAGYASSSFDTAVDVLIQHGILMPSFNGTFFGDKVVKDGDHAGDG